jgi:hypothetical protein
MQFKLLRRRTSSKGCSNQAEQSEKIYTQKPQLQTTGAACHVITHSYALGAHASSMELSVHAAGRTTSAQRLQQQHHTV